MKPMTRSSTSSILSLCFLLFSLVAADLRVGFYKASCPQAESIIQQVVSKRFSTDTSITAAFLRMHFHDCFVRGCDASILIDSTKKKPSEKSAGPNLTVRGFEIIDEAKKALEAACPSTVSCADIVTLATRDSVVLAGGPTYAAPPEGATGSYRTLTKSTCPVHLFLFLRHFSFSQPKA